MKTGADVFRRAMSLLSYTGIDGAVSGSQSAELYRRGLHIVNQVLADLWPLEKEEEFSPLKSLNDNLPLSAQSVENVMPYGVALFLAQAEGDGTNQQFYSALYQQKRNAIKKPFRERLNVIPTPEEE